MQLRKDRAKRKREAMGQQVRVKAPKHPELLDGGVPHTSYDVKVESKSGELKYRWDILNHLIKHFGYQRYLEMGVCGHNLKGEAAGGECFKRVDCKIKFGIDPAFPKDDIELEKLASMYMTQKDGAVVLYSCTSDHYFDHINWGAWPGKKENESEFGEKVYGEDIVFVDSSHLPAQAMRDFENWTDPDKHRLSDNGTLVFHDAYPNPEYFKPGHIIGGGKGSIWIVMAQIHLFNPNFTVWTLGLDNGMGIVRPIKRDTLPTVDFTKMGVPERTESGKGLLDYIDIADVAKYGKDLLNVISLDEFRRIFS